MRSVGILCPWDFAIGCLVRNFRDIRHQDWSLFCQEIHTLLVKVLEQDFLTVLINQAHSVNNSLHSLKRKLFKVIKLPLQNLNFFKRILILLFFNILPIKSKSGFVRTKVV